MNKEKEKGQAEDMERTDQQVREKDKQIGRQIQKYTNRCKEEILKNHFGSIAPHRRTLTSNN